ncbi:ABC transporter A family member 2 isoform X2 [Spinacia oleracea]|uniref:ABC transporter A family member 2 isoform X2 n=1 Tax=Spinacia oleracea TaxID=3562 RepID=A0ABM3QSX0_SPIOL|nr:ABC transporter A family member 2-like isoform X2 [Spinacia oleracea]
MGTLNRGVPLMIQQGNALVKKNLWLAMRSKYSSLLQLFAPFIFLLFLFAVDKSRRHPSTSPELRNPPVINTPSSIPPCETKFHIRRPCFDFVWSGNTSLKAHDIVSRIMANNPGRTIPPYKVRSFGTPDEVDAWLYNDPLRCPVALHFVEKTGSVMGYGIQTNYTTTSIRGKSENPTLQFQIPLQIAAERELARSVLADQSFSWTVRLKELPHHAETLGYNSSGLEFLAPLFLFTIAMFPFVFQVTSIVLEKEMKLRQAMNIMGLYDSAYWVSWLVWEIFVILILSLCTLLSGMILQFSFFLHNSFAIMFLLFFLFQLNMTSFAFMLSAFLSKSSSAFRAGFWIFLIGIILQITAIVSGASKKSRMLYFLPPCLLSHALQMLVTATGSDNSPGISWSNRAKCPTGDSDCYYTMNDIYMRLIYTFVCWFLLALYFDNVIPSNNGTKKSLLYFLNPRYWVGIEGNRTSGGICDCFHSESALDNITPGDVDVLEEENDVKQSMRSDEIDPNIAVQIRGLVKTYPGKLNFGCCCKCYKTDPFHAIKGLYINLPQDELFCLLGPNGAGKTTAINCLTGITSVTAGDAIIYRNSIRSSVGMSNIRKLIGVCPQFDVLWNELTGEENLQLFARIKGLQPASITETTGMDPISRRHVWDIIENAKRGRVVILTTHSMEEADILGDRLGIMAKGRLRCIGTSIRLKTRFGTGFSANLSLKNDNSAENSAHKETVKEFFRHNLGVSPKEENNAYLTFEIPRQKEPLLKETLGELQDKQQEFGVADIQLGLTTLEEVFLNIARQAELESAAAEGRTKTLTLSSGTLVQVPVGARYVAIPGSETAENPRGIMVEVHWEQNDSGALCISGHSTERPVPPNVQPSLPVAHPRSLGKPEGTVGRVIDPSQLSDTSFHS